jgi:hypothetical protein
MLATLAGMQNVREEDKAAILQLLERQQANQVQLNALSNNMGAGVGLTQNSASPTENTDLAAANNSAAAFQLNNNMGMNPMMLNPMMVGMGMGMNMNMASMNNNFMNFEGMTPQQALMANPAGFNLPVVQTSQEDPGWEEQYFALKAYQRENGHCKVPARYKANPKLGRWVMTQRRQFTLLMQGYPSALTSERIQKLEIVGFTWSIRPEPVKTWNRKFHELKVYKNTFGNCMVPQRYQANPQLGTWVHTQRRQYKLMIEGKKSSMTREKAQALDSIGFFWAAKPSSSSRSSNSNVQLTQLALADQLNNASGLIEN